MFAFACPAGHAVTGVTANLRVICSSFAELASGNTTAQPPTTGTTATSCFETIAPDFGRSSVGLTICSGTLVAGISVPPTPAACVTALEDPYSALAVLDLGGSTPQTFCVQTDAWFGVMLIDGGEVTFTEMVRSAGGGSSCTASISSFGAVPCSATFDPGDAPNDGADDRLEFTATLGAGQPADAFAIILSAGYGAFSAGAITPGTYQLAGEELNFATCGVCVLLRTAAGEDYMAVSGTVTITAAGTAAGGALSGSFGNLVLQHVTIDETTGETTPASSSTRALANGTFSATLNPEP